VPAAPAGAAEGFSCPTGTDAVEVPYAWDGYTPLLAGTVCVVSDATQYVSVHIEPGWTAKASPTAPAAVPAPTSGSPRPSPATESS
jgi:hypothetical protein